MKIWLFSVFTTTLLAILIVLFTPELTTFSNLLRKNLFESFVILFLLFSTTLLLIIMHKIKGILIIGNDIPPAVFEEMDLINQSLTEMKVVKGNKGM